MPQSTPTATARPAADLRGRVDLGDTDEFDAEGDARSPASTAAVPVAGPPRPVRRPPPPIRSRGDEPSAKTAEIAEPAENAEPAPALPDAPARVVVCPFCGSRRAEGEAVGPGGPTPCPRCTVTDTPDVRAATRRRVGPWAVYQERVPSAPGMNFRTLVALATAGRVTPASVVRGPTTGQLWRPADRVRGLAREFGRCHGCAKPVRPDAVACPACGRDQRPPADPDALVAPLDPSDDAPQAMPAPAPAPAADRPPPAADRTAPPARATMRPATTTPAAVPTPGQARSLTDARASTPAATRPARPPSRASVRAASAAAATADGRGAILSARELASAFQLATAPGFDPDDPTGDLAATRRAGAVPGARLDFGGRRERARDPDRRRTPGRRVARRVGWTVAAGLLVASLGVGGLWAYPPTRPDVEAAGRAVSETVADLLPTVEF